MKSLSLIILLLGSSHFATASSVLVSLRERYENASFSVNLTEAGALDWYLFDGDSDPAMIEPSNSKSGADFLGEITALGDLMSDSGVFDSRTTYTYTDGSDPASATTTDFDRMRLSEEGAGIRFTVDLPDAGTYRLEVNCLTANRTNLGMTATLESGPTNQFQGSPLGGVVRYNFSISVETDGPDTLTVDLVRANGSDSQFAVETIALREAPLLPLLRLYHIGNSLTVDALGVDVGTDLLSETLTLNEIATKRGYHINCSQSLDRIVEDPDSTCEEAPTVFGRWPNALGNFEWDAVTLQAFPGASAEDEVAATVALINAATTGGRNQDCIFYLYQAWPQRSTTETVSERIDSEFGGPTTSTFLSSEFVDYWYAEVLAALPGFDIRLIPAGAVLRELDQRLMAEPTAGFDEGRDLYRDVDHLSFDEGRHLAYLTMASILSGISPSELTYGVGVEDRIPAAYDELVQEVVAEVIANEPRTQGPTIIPTDGLSIQLLRNANTDSFEITYEGVLYQSTNLDTWTIVTGASSPFTVPTSAPATIFYRAQTE